MSCKVEINERKTVIAPKGCVVCRESGKTQRLVILINGREYQKCEPVVLSPEQPETGCCVVQPMTAPGQTIYGVITCYQNLKDAPEGEVCKTNVLRCATFDMKSMCWPDSFTEEDLERIACTHDKPCFVNREGCLEKPDWVSGQPVQEKI